MAISIDLTIPLKREFEKARKQFDDAKSLGNIEEAKKMALVCCNILIQLAKSDPNKKSEYIDAAKSTKTMRIQDRNQSQQVHPKVILNKQVIKKIYRVLLRV